MRLVRWSPKAAADLAGIVRYQASDSEERARSTARHLFAAANSLRLSPFTAATGPVAGTRELVTLPLPYIITYSVDREAVHILRIRHGRQNWLQ